MPIFSFPVGKSLLIPEICFWVPRIYYGLTLVVLSVGRECLKFENFKLKLLRERKKVKLTFKLNYKVFGGSLYIRLGHINSSSRCKTVAFTMNSPSTNHFCYAIHFVNCRLQRSPNINQVGNWAIQLSQNLLIRSTHSNHLLNFFSAVQIQFSAVYCVNFLFKLVLEIRRLLQSVLERIFVHWKSKFFHFHEDVLYGHFDG